MEKTANCWLINIGNFIVYFLLCINTKNSENSQIMKKVDISIFIAVLEIFENV